MSETAAVRVGPGDGGRPLPGGHQSQVPADKVLHSGNAGFLIARTAQIKPEFRAEGRRYATDMVRYLNGADLNGASFFLFQEAFGWQDRVHILMHWKSPDDYALSFSLVDEDPEMIALLQANPEPVVEQHVDDGGNWAKMMVESSMRERVLVPQHTPTHGDDDHHDDGTWVEPAWRQVASQSAEQQLNTANAPLVVHRVAQAKHAYRDEARMFGFAWQNHINKVFAGDLTSYLYEENFGQMDRLHWLIHLRSYDVWSALMGLPEVDAQYAELFTRPFVPARRGGGTWAHTFVAGTMQDTLLVPYQLSAAG